MNATMFSPLVRLRLHASTTKSDPALKLRSNRRERGSLARKATRNSTPVYPHFNSSFIAFAKPISLGLGFYHLRGKAQCANEWIRILSG